MKPANNMAAQIHVPTSEGDDATFGPDHRVTCLLCLNRSGTRCEPLGTSHVPLDVKHDCAHYRARQRRAA